MGQVGRKWLQPCSPSFFLPREKAAGDVGRDNGSLLGPQGPKGLPSVLLSPCPSIPCLVNVGSPSHQPSASSSQQPFCTNLKSFDLLFMKGKNTLLNKHIHMGSMCSPHKKPARQMLSSPPPYRIQRKGRE